MVSLEEDYYSSTYLTSSLDGGEDLKSNDKSTMVVET